MKVFQYILNLYLQVYKCVKDNINANGFNPTQNQIEKITNMISKSEIERWEKNHAKGPSQHPWSSFVFSEKHEKNVSDYVATKFKKR